MMKYSAPKGTRDILPDEIGLWEELEETFRQLCKSYGYKGIRTPVFESTSLFIRSIGEDTDIVDKEMYTFLDRGKKSITLCPEETAPIIRAYIQNNLDKVAPITKLYYISPMFRYDRPQAGRYKQFYQAGVETIGSSDPSIDAEIILLAMSFFEKIKLKDTSLQINSVGCSNCRPSYKKKLKDLLKDKVSGLCKDCKKRYNTNPLRILDCKQKICREKIKDTPPIMDTLCAECKIHFDKVMEILNILDVSYQINQRLVRGLDYYTKTAFEIVSFRIGAQNALCGGGRYDGLIEECGGSPTGAVGFAIGMDRTIDAIRAEGIETGSKEGISVFIATIGEKAKIEGIRILKDLRERGISSDTEYINRSLKSQMRYADKINCKYVLILGEDELNKGKAILREMATGSQKEIDLQDIWKNF